MRQAIAVLLTLIALYAAYQGQLLVETQREGWYAAAYFLIAVVILIIADRWGRVSLAGKERGSSGPAEEKPSRFGRLGWLGALAVALAVGVFCRVHQLDAFPSSVWFDEAQNGIVARQILEDPSYRPVFIGELTQLPALFFYVFAASMKVLGSNVFALRAVTTLAGIATLFFMYLLAQELFDRRIAVIATFFLAVMRWHVNFSRFGMHGIFTPLFLTATFYFLVRALKGKGAANFAVAGIMFGIGLQGHYAFLLSPLIIGLYLFHHLIFGRVLPWRRLLSGLALMGLTTSVVYSPVAVWAVRNPIEFQRRLGTASLTRGRPIAEVASELWETTRKHALMFNSMGDGNGRHNLPGTAMLDTYTALLFALGVGYALWRWKNSACFLLLCWLIILLQAGIWSVPFEAPQAYRTFGVTPAVAFLAALPLGVLWRLASARHTVQAPAYIRYSSRTLILTATVVTGLLIAQATRSNYETYFGVQATRSDVWASYSADATFVGRELARLGNDYMVYASPVFPGVPTVRFVAPEAPSPTPLDVTRDLPLVEVKPTAFLLDHRGGPTIELLKTYYPNSQFAELTAPGGGEAIVYEAVIPAQEIEATRGWSFHYERSGTNQRGKIPNLDLDWRKVTPLRTPFRARWKGLLKIPQYGSYLLEVKAPGAVKLSLNGKRQAAGSGKAVAEQITLAEGLHDVDIEAEVRSRGLVQLAWKPASSETEPVPERQLFSKPIKRSGLEGHYYSDADGHELKFVRVDSNPGGHFHLMPVPVPYSVHWHGTLHIPKSNTYRFYVQAVDEGVLRIDANTLAETPGPNVVAEAKVDLNEGPHQIDLVFRQRGGHPAYINFLWADPHSVPQPVPVTLLSPP
jgi:4-amino-4-deoxy-L-arabinose transferase-like glycosyltransferase